MLQVICKSKALSIDSPLLCVCELSIVCLCSTNLAKSAKEPRGFLHLKLGAVRSLPKDCATAVRFLLANAGRNLRTSCNPRWIWYKFLHCRSKMFKTFQEHSSRYWVVWGRVTLKRAASSASQPGVSPHCNVPCRPWLLCLVQSQPVCKSTQVPRASRLSMSCLAFIHKSSIWGVDKPGQVWTASTEEETAWAQS